MKKKTKPMVCGNPECVKETFIIYVNAEHIKLCPACYFKEDKEDGK